MGAGRELITGPVMGTEPEIEPFRPPNGARVVVSVQIALEAWSGTNTSGNALGRPLSERAQAMGVPDWATISSQEYGGRTGIWRILALLDEEQVPASCSTSTLVAERWPAVVRAVVAGGHEIVSHGYSQDQPMSDLDEAGDYAVLRGAQETFERVAGYRPVGHSSHGCRRGNHTIANMLELGYLYSNDFRDADLPYVVARAGERRIVAVPRTDEINDMFLFRRTGNPPDVYAQYFRSAFDELYREGGGQVLSCVGHAIIAGRPWGIDALRQCIRYAKQFDDVWITTRREIAAACLAGASAVPTSDPGT